MKTRPRRRAPGNVTPSYLVRIDLKKQAIFAAVNGKRTVNPFVVATEAGTSPAAVRAELKRLGWKQTTKPNSLDWFLP
jgi:hypothetical protein